MSCSETPGSSARTRISFAVSLTSRFGTTVAPSEATDRRGAQDVVEQPVHLSVHREERVGEGEAERPAAAL